MSLDCPRCVRRPAQDFGQPLDWFEERLLPSYRKNVFHLPGASSSCMSVCLVHDRLVCFVVGLSAFGCLLVRVVVTSWVPTSLAVGKRGGRPGFRTRCGQVLHVQVTMCM